ncbi:hypothetical protein L1987_80233 [Smallanthus sonchifolius]|uniref:Uncharacterized protein n=1 Tax=Smallanthus sonchifolius TaxID=185202 RepID=A0ACB8YMJ2_9ASTR|nr:hypothetical protein L1987_80233 [Smallanthus sonchifolius]
MQKLSYYQIQIATVWPPISTVVSPTTPLFHSQHGRQLHSTRRLAPACVAVKGLILANVAVFLLWRVADEKFMRQNFTIEQLFGPEFLLKLYLVGAFVASVSFLADRAFLAPSSKDNQLSKLDRSKGSALGASGAVYALIMLDILLSPYDILPVKFIIPIPTLLRNLGRNKKSKVAIIFHEDSKIAGAAHLGGAAVGIIAWAWLRKGGSLPSWYAMLIANRDCHCTDVPLALPAHLLRFLN